jgi:hypothetical protein
MKGDVFEKFIFKGTLLKQLYQDKTGVKNMFENRYPIFKRGELIDKKELDLLRDNPEEMLKLMYMDRKNGIIKGFEIISDTEKREVKIMRGIVKYRETLYKMSEDYIFSMPEVENKYILKLRLMSDMEDKKYYIRRGEFILTEEEKILDNEIEITRFITRTGAELRNDYKDFKDLRRDFNLLEIINVKYSSRNEKGTLHPKILKLWGMEASKKENLDIFDINFYNICLQQDIIEREIIIAYINRKLRNNKEDYTNEEIYKNLLKILENLGNERTVPEKKRIIPKKITIE